MFVFDKDGGIQNVNEDRFHSNEDYYIYMYRICYGIVYTYDQYNMILDQIKKTNINYLSIKDASISDNHSMCKIKYI